MSADLIAGIRTDCLAAFAAREAAIYAKARPKALKALTASAGNFLGGVPMHWMADWPMPHLPLIARRPRRADRGYRNGVKSRRFLPLATTGIHRLPIERLRLPRAHRG